MQVQVPIPAIALPQLPEWNLAAQALGTVAQNLHHAEIMKKQDMKKAQYRVTPRRPTHPPPPPGGQNPLKRAKTQWDFKMGRPSQGREQLNRSGSEYEPDEEEYDSEDLDHEFDLDGAPLDAESLNNHGAGMAGAWGGGVGVGVLDP